MTFMHALAHKLGWWSGHVVSRTDPDGRIYIGFMCSRCSRVMSEHDATNIIDRYIAAHKERRTKKAGRK